MGKEIERKWLVPDDFMGYTSKDITLIKQGYIFIGENKHLRIRLSKKLTGNKAYLCIKYTGKQERDEYEYEIPYSDGVEMYERCEDKLEKIRYNWEHLFSPEEVKEIILDEYPTGLKISEVEFPNFEASTTFNFSPFTSWSEVTGNYLYSNIKFAIGKLVFN